MSTRAARRGLASGEPHCCAAGGGNEPDGGTISRALAGILAEVGRVLPRQKGGLLAEPERKPSRREAMLRFSILCGAETRSMAATASGRWPEVSEKLAAGPGGPR